MIRRATAAALACAAVIAVGADAAADGVITSDADCSTRTDASCGQYGGFVDMRIGRATAPFPVPGLPTVRSEFTQAIAVVVGGHYVIGRGYAVGLRIPMAPSPVELPGGSYVDDKAFGNPELFGERALPPRALRGARLSLRLRGAIGLPLAFRGPVGAVTRPVVRSVHVRPCAARSAAAHRVRIRSPTPTRAHRPDPSPASRFR